MQIRLVCESDLLDLAALYEQTILTHGPQKYTLAQTHVWASFASQTDAFRQFILNATTYVAEDETGIIGFAGIEENGHISATYVRGDRLHQGVGTALMQTLLTHAAHRHMPRLYAEASEFSLGLFKKFGFNLYDLEVVERNEVEFTRYLVERALTTAVA